METTTPDVLQAGGIRTILFATDFSANARAALVWAVSLARVHGADLHLVHALIPVDGLSHPSARIEGVKDFALFQLRALAREVGLSPGQIDWTTEPGRAFEVIREKAVATAAGLIVMGTEGRTGLQRLLLRSTAERVASRAPCPVLTVHEYDRRQNRAPQTVLIPTDLSHTAGFAVRRAREIFGGDDCCSNLVLLHVLRPRADSNQDLWRLGPPPASGRTSWDEPFDRFIEEVAEPMRREGRTVRTLLREGPLPKVVGAVASETNADLIALAGSARPGLSHLFGSVAARVLRRAPCPVLVAPEPRSEMHEMRETATQSSERSIAASTQSSARANPARDQTGRRDRKGAIQPICRRQVDQ